MKSPQQNIPSINLTHLSLCTGYGGIDLGLKSVLSHKVHTIAYSEIDAFAIYNLLTKMESGFLDAAPIWTDLKTFPWADFKYKVNILSGGFPCQPFSIAGKKSLDEDPRHLWPSIIEGVETLRFPHILFFENVQGIVNTHLKSEGWEDPPGTPILLHILRELERREYECQWGIFSAEMVGAPQIRKRVFILARHQNIPLEVSHQISRDLTPTSRVSTTWPSRIHQPANGWEPPKALIEGMPTLIKAHNKALHAQTACPEWESAILENNTALSRVEELKLLGNGVIPQVAQLAFATLWKQFS